MLECQLPDHPKTEVRESTIIIVYENGDEEIWGRESNDKIAIEVAKDIELGLKAINYSSMEIIKRLSDISEELISLGIPREYTNDYVSEGYRKVARWFKKLDSATIQAR